MSRAERHDGCMEVWDFTLNGRSGYLAVEYRPNDDIESSGFDMFDPSDFDPALAIGYPTIRAWVHDYRGTGYRTASAFIQWIDIERRGPGAAKSTELDTIAAFENQGVPFFSCGYPANLYDAPAHNLQGATWMSWIATTWFVTLPARWTDHEIRPLRGFTWGYEEDTDDGVTVLPLRKLDSASWDGNLPRLRDQCPGFRFAAS